MAVIDYTTIITVTSLLIGCVLTQDATVKFTVREERPINTLVGSVAVESLLFTNMSNGEFQELTFQILTLGNKYVNMFYIGNDTGLLWTNEVIDREEFLDCFETCEIDFNVGVYDTDLTVVPKIIKTVINIDDFNDHSPEFLFSQQELRVSEATDVGEVIIRESAMDLDGDPRLSVQTYTLLPQTENFELKTVEGEELAFEILLKQKLDRETAPLYKIVVIAIDGGSSIRNTGTLMLDIIVTDDNDNFPEFTKKMYNASIAENVTVNSTVLVVEASDIDHGDNAKITYMFSNRVPDRVLKHFSINSTSGELTVSHAIDYDEEKEKEFDFQILAVDHGSPQKSTAVDIYVKIEDVNDNFPQINIFQPPGGTVLSEHAVVDSFVAHVEVTDKDSGNNGMVTCNILDPHFRLDDFGIENNYRIVLDQSLDHDTKPEHNVSIICQDKGDLPKQNKAHFIVHVSDRNDNPPEFTLEKYTATVTENNEKGLYILEVSARDEDSGLNGEVRYSLQAESAELFVIDPLTGVITTNVSLDRETHGDEIIFRVLATDGGDPENVSTGTVVVRVMDLNDNAPIFSSDPFEFHVYENQPNSTQVGNITVSDPDKGLNGTFYMKYPMSPDVLEYFTFSDNSIITTTKPLDRELQSTHMFYVHAVDYGGRTSSALVVVSVKDENDNVPQITYPDSEDNMNNIPVSTLPGSSVLQVSARDYDEGENAQLYYYIDSNNASYTFSMDLHTGVMYINNTMHASDINNVYRFTIRVMDGGNPRLSTNTTLYIRIVEGEAQRNVDTTQAKTNLIIVVVVVVSVTLVLSLIMITIMIRICVGGRRKNGSTASSEIIIESKELDPRLLDSSMSSTSSKDSNGNEKLRSDFPNSYLQPEKENSSIPFANLSTVNKDLDNQIYIEKAKQFGYEMNKKIDETNSDNSGEMETRDSGQGGSDLDMNSLSELPVLDIPDSPFGSKPPSNSIYPSPPNSYFGYHDNRKNISDNKDRNFIQDSSRGQNSVNNCVQNYSKTAERKEFSKGRKNPKRVMFSDDLESSSATSNTLSSVTFSDQDTTVPSSRPTTYSRLHSFDSTGVTSSRNNFYPGSPLRRSVDHLLLTRNNRYARENRIDNKNLPSLSEKHNLPSKNWLDYTSDTNAPVFSLTHKLPSHLDTSNNRASFPNSYSVHLTDFPSSPLGTDDTIPNELCV